MEEEILNLVNVCVNKGKFSLKDISFKIEEGYLMGIIGKNGAGKTTLLNTIIGKNGKYTGRILYKGKDIKEKYKKFMEECAYISEDAVFLKEDTILNNVRLLSVFNEKFDEENFVKMLTDNGISEDKFIDRLSRGQFIKLQLCLARAMGKKLYLMDEVTAGMDPVYRKEFYKELKTMQQEGCTIIMTTHIVSDLNRNMDYIVELENGKIESIRENDGGFCYE